MGDGGASAAPEHYPIISACKRFILKGDGYMRLMKYTLDDFSRGFRADKVSDTMESGATPEAYNFSMLNGTLKTMRGYSVYSPNNIVYNGQTYRIMLPMVYYSAKSTVSSNKDVLMVVGSTGSIRCIFVYENGRWVKEDGNMSEADMGYVNYYFNSANYLLVTNELDGMLKYDRMGKLEFFEDTPLLSSMTVHHDRVWGIGYDSMPNTVMYSAVGDPALWEEDGQLSISTYDGDRFIYIDSVFDDIVLYRNKSLFRIVGTDPDNYRLQQIPAATGACGKLAVANDGKRSFYVGDDGIYEFDGIRADMLENDGLRLFFEEKVNKDRLQWACACIFGGKLYVSLPIEGAMFNNAVIEYDLASKSFAIRRGINAACLFIFADKLMFSDDEGYLYTLDDGTTLGGEIIRAHYATPHTDLGAKNKVKTLDSIYIVARGTGKLQITAETENDVSVKTVEMRSSTDLDVYKVEMYAMGRRFRFAFDNVDGSVVEIVRPEFYFEVDEED